MAKLELISGRLALPKWKQMITTFELVRDSCINLFYKREIFDETIENISGEGIGIYGFDAANWNEVEFFYDDFAQGMNFPDYFGRNLDAVNDCLRDLIGNNIAICISNYEFFMQKCPKEANILPRIILRNCWESILQESIMIMLIQTHKGDISFPELKELTPKWNDQEWLMKDHGL